MVAIWAHDWLDHNLAPNPVRPGWWAKQVADGSCVLALPARRNLLKTVSVIYTRHLHAISCLKAQKHGKWWVMPIQSKGCRQRTYVPTILCIAIYVMIGAFQGRKMLHTYNSSQLCLQGREGELPALSSPQNKLKDILQTIFKRNDQQVRVDDNVRSLLCCCLSAS